MAGDKRRGDGGGRGGGGGGKRAKYVQNKVSNQALPIGSRGILITCDAGREDRTAAEMYTVLEEHYNKLSGAADKAGPSDADGGKQDIASALEAEVAQLKDKKKKLFQVTHPGIRGCVYFEFPKEPEHPTPVDVVISVCDEAVKTRTLRGRHVNRVLPISHTCYASLEEMKTLAPKALLDDFPKETDQGVEFAVEYEHRSSDKFDRMAVIDAFVDSVATPPHKVNLSAPAKTIIVQVARNSCGVSVVPRYRELCKFNLRTCTQEPDADGKQQGKSAGQEKKAAQAEDAGDAANAGDAKETQPAAETKTEEKAEA